MSEITCSELVESIEGFPLPLRDHFDIIPADE